MDSELEKIDAIRSRFRVSYAEAREALKESSGDLIGALTLIEQKKKNVDLLTLCAEVAGEVQKLAGGDPIRKLKIKYGDKTVVETPVALTAIAAVAVGVAAALISKLIIEVEKGQEEAVG